ncbi:DUF4369 domain-containing protein [Gaetbulibacter saemankumensis]|uniref:DUF4369 domain-containing protein n=1 Tax=Gaetbulibacter saemankumensis TaxID=311208 RepID=UPI0004267497|nr:DUF4369 domain-containing protein [Gaetbulibacter saemankumensis]
MKKLSILTLTLLIISCSKTEHDLTVKTNISGLQKGIVYLKKMQDTSLITIDSVVVSGNPQIELYSPIESPEIFFLDLDKNSSESERIAFFADKGVTEITTSIKNFTGDAKINGSKQQELLAQYKKMMTRFNHQNLDLIKAEFEAKKDNNSSKVDSIQAQYKSLLKRKYLFTVNFALNNKDSEVAPYLALTEIYNAKINLLDTINNSLTDNVKNSKYGQKLQAYIEDIKKSE